MMDRFEFQSLESRLLFSIPVLAPGLTAFGDFNGDHKADEAIVYSNNASRNSTITIAEGTGNGLFLQSASTSIPNFRPTAVTVGDVNGDGLADVVIAGSSGIAVPRPVAFLTNLPAQNEVVVLLGNGKGGFLQSSAAGGVSENIYSIPNLLSTTSVAVGDFDGDHFADIAVLGHARAATIGATAALAPSTIDMLWDVTKPAATPLARKLSLGSPVSTNSLITPPGNPNVNTLFAGDLDGDGRMDLVAALSAQGSLSSVPRMPTLSNIIALVRPDLVTVGFPSNRTPIITVGHNPLDLALPLRASTIAFPTEQTLGLAALVHGGQLDLVGLRGNAIVYAGYNPATESFGPAQAAQSQNTPANLFSDTVYLADVTGDGSPDLLAQTDNGTFLGRNVPSATANSVLFSWNSVILPPGTPTVLS